MQAVIDIVLMGCKRALSTISAKTSVLLIDKLKLTIDRDIK